MEKIGNNINGIQNIGLQNTVNKKYKQKPNLIQQKDTVQISHKKRNIAIGAAIVALSIAAITTAYLIGKNPAKAAKVLKGGENFADDAYKEGSKLADEIINKEGEFKTSFEKLAKSIKTPKYPTELSEKLNKLEKYIKENNISENSELSKAAKTLRGNLTEYIGDIENKMFRGEFVNDFEKQMEFGQKNEKLGKIISDELGGASSLGVDFKFIRNHIEYQGYIKEIPVDLISKDGTFFHGTQKAKAVYKKGFTPFVSNQLSKSPRELGAGIYLTSDPEVAGYFAGLKGRIIPLKLAPDAKVAFVGQNGYSNFNYELSKFINERMGASYKTLPDKLKHATSECLVKKVFQQAGYDAAYLPKGVKGGFINLAPDINKVIGKDQKQLVIFSPDKIEITSRKLSERISDVKARFAAFNRALKFQKENPYAFMFS